MRRLDEFAEEARKVGLQLRVDTDHLDRVARLASDGLFHVPLLAFCILVITRARKGGLETADLAAWTGAALGHHFSSIQAAHRKLEWSIQHRKRCADALVFLENVALVIVEEKPSRTVRCTTGGLDVVRKLLRRPDEVGVLARGLDRAHRAVEHHGLELL